MRKAGEKGTAHLRTFYAKMEKIYVIKEYCSKVSKALSPLGRGLYTQDRQEYLNSAVTKQNHNILWYVKKMAGIFTIFSFVIPLYQD